MQDLSKKLQDLATNISQAINKLDIETDERQVKQLELETQAPDFWDDPTAAGEVSARLAGLKKHVDSWRELERQVADALELAQADDRSLQEELETTYTRLAEEFSSREFELKLSGPYDKNSAILSIHAGTGGTDAQDWSEMLLRMYLRWAEKLGFVTEILDQSPGEEAGLKSVTLEVNGQFAYGRLKGEKGVHRLVRLSPFNADHLRQTSFAMVEVLPQIEQQPEFDIDPKDLRVDVFRAGGHGGQSVNTTDSAVRITHLPTGIVVSIQNERSQLQNKEKAMAVLRARLAALMLEQHKQTIAELKGKPEAIAWGNQIRSYVLHPYTKVKDHRTGHETSQAQEVLDGDLEPFIDSFLASQIGQ